MARGGAEDGGMSKPMLIAFDFLIAASHYGVAILARGQHARRWSAAASSLAPRAINKPGISAPGVPAA